MTSKNIIFTRVGLGATLFGVAGILASCVAPSGPSDFNKSRSIVCEAPIELITDPLFATISDVGSKWQYRQHSGENSFRVTAKESTITFERIGSEPWAVLRQTITDERLGGATIRYTADLRGDVSSEVTHMFGAKAGLFLQLGKHPDAFMGDQEPSAGQWDWQTFSVTETLPVGLNSVRVGFIHQAGEGAIQARNPSLVLVNCAE